MTTLLASPLIGGLLYWLLVPGVLLVMYETARIVHALHPPGKLCTTDASRLIVLLVCLALALGSNIVLGLVPPPGSLAATWLLGFLLRGVRMGRFAVRPRNATRDRVDARASARSI
ncbi:MAG TPA: hypothetical protein VF594_10990 [Rubricoccaceae bacterium]|jgi:hypothetical protein